MALTRASAGYFKGPCPACGTQGEWPKGSICDKCNMKLKKFEELMLEQKNKNLKPYSIPGVPWALAYVPHDVATMGSNAPSIGSVFYKLLIAVSSATEVEWHAAESLAGLKGSNQHTNIARAMPEEVAHLFVQLFGLIRQQQDAAYKAGQERGRNALIQLNAGEISIADFERTTPK